MKTQSLLGVLTSTVLLAGLIGGQMLRAEPVRANRSILDPLEPQNEIEPFEGASLPETTSEESQEQVAPPQVELSEVSAELDQEVVTAVPKESKAEPQPILGRVPSPTVSLETVTDWERLGLNRPRLIPNNQRQGYQKKFVTDQFFKEKLVIPPDFSGDEPAVSSELSRICYVLSGQLLVGRKGQSLY